MTFAMQTNKLPTPSSPAWVETQVAVALKDHCYLLTDGRLAKQALSCLITPETGDRVLAAGCRGGDIYIVHVLNRTTAEAAELHAPGMQRLHVRQAHIALHAGEQMTLHALRDVEISAASGNLSLNARNLFCSVQDALVQTARHVVGTAEHYLLEVKQLLKMSGQQTLITAKKDVKVDGERISIG
jgi:hypothetical protein